MKPNDKAPGEAVAPELTQAIPPRLMEAVLSIADDAVIVVDDAHRIVLFNDGAEQIFRYRAKDLIGRGIDPLLPDHVRADHGRHIAEFAASGLRTRRMGERGEITGRRSSGETFPAEATICHVEVEGRHYFAVILRDVSERRAAVQALRRSEARFRALAEASPVGIFETDGSGRFAYVNARWCEMAGMRVEEAQGEGWARAVHPEDRSRVHQAWVAAVGGRRPFNAEYRFLRPDGAEIWVAASAVPATFDAPREHGYVGTVADITERRAQATALEKAMQEAEAAARAKSLFLANMSHEIRTPLNAVIGMTSLLLDTEISDEQKDFAQTIRASGEALLAIINDILDFSKIDLGRLDLEQQVFDLRRTIEDSLDLLAPQASEKGINLAYFIEDGTPGTLVGDVTRLRQILVNLISNAVKFTHQGEVVVTVDALQLAEDSHRIHFAIRDTGIGINRDRLPHLFQSFTQVDPSTTRKYGGTGLGLAISKRLAELMQGTAWVESEVGSGSVFHFTIVAQAGPEADHQYLRRSQPLLAGKRVLVVDDNITNRRILVKQALLWGMMPSASPSALEALDLIRHGNQFDVAILDVGMPEMDGIDLAWEIRNYRDPQQLPIILLTSMGQRLNMPQDGELRLAAYLNKPIKPAQLFHVLTAALGTPISPAEAPRSPVEKHLAERMPLRILVAEDNAINQKVVLRILSRLGYRADVAANGHEVLSAVDRQRYDVILMDIQMPEMDGIEATRRMLRRFDHHETPRIIAMTANAMPGDRERCLAVGMDAYITKPIDLDDLRSALLGLPQRSVRGAEDVTAPLVDRRRLDQLAEIEKDYSSGLVREVIDLFLANADGQLRALREAVVSADAAALRQTAHRFKSSADNLGARRVADLCEKLEALGRAGIVEGANELLAVMDRECERTNAVLRGEREHY
ncbi:MAG TPA: response regulator [Pelomicrobium sp.]|nr:response regulator [Pelomicrobium sp.]